MREWWFTFGSGLAIGWFARYAWQRIREECDLLDRRYEAVRAARQAVRDRDRGALFDFDDVSGQPHAGPDELGWPPPPRRRFDQQRPRRD